MSPRIPTTSIVSCMVLLLVGRAISQSCWYPDGLTQAQADVPCDPDAATSACCGPNGFCLSNGLCLVNGAVSRGSCTDKNWGQGCAQICADGKSRPRSNHGRSGLLTSAPVATDVGVVLQPCNPAQNTFVCNLFNQSCDSSSFTMEGANTIVLRPDQVENGSLQQRRINPTSTFVASSSNASNASSTGFSTVDVIGIAVGIGVPLLAALSATTFIAISQRRRIRALKAEPKLSKDDSEFINSAYAHSVPLHAPSPAYGGFEYNPLTNFRPQGHFHEVMVNELDGTAEPRELGTAKPRN